MDTGGGVPAVQRVLDAVRRPVKAALRRRLVQRRATSLRCRPGRVV